MTFETKTWLQDEHNKVVISTGSRNKVVIWPIETKVELPDGYEQLLETKTELPFLKKAILKHL